MSAHNGADRSVPHNLEAERALLGAVLVDNGAYAVAADGVTGATFFRRAHGRIWEALATLMARSGAADLVTVKHELEHLGELEDVGGASYIASLVDGVPRSTNVAHYAGIVRDLKARRALIEMSTRVMETAYMGTETAVDLLDLCATDLDTIRTRLLHGARGGRHIRLLLANTIAIKPVFWLWEGRMALGTFGLLGGRESIGKSMVAYTLAADVTLGRLAGACHGIPKAVVIVATEDSKAHTIVPRLMSAGADLSRIAFVTVATPDGTESELVLPVDVPELARVIREMDAVLVLFDPLLSRLDAVLDSHKDAEVRRGIEPLAKLADETGACFLGLIHVNKTTTSDPLTMLMASRAFAAVARWVLFAMLDPADETRRLLGLIKNNLGRTDLPTLCYRIVNQHVATTDQGDVWTGRLDWDGEAEGSIRDAVQTEASGDGSAVAEATDWLQDYLDQAGGSVDSAIAKAAGQTAGHSGSSIRRARERLRLRIVPTSSVPRRTIWLLPLQSCHARGGSRTTGTTSTTGDIFRKNTQLVVPVVPVVSDPARGDTTGDTTGPEAEGRGFSASSVENASAQLAFDPRPFLANGHPARRPGEP